MKLKEGDCLIFHFTNSFIGKAIAWYNLCKFGDSFGTHTGIITEVGVNGIVLWESLAGGPEENLYEIDWIESMIQEGHVKVLRSIHPITKPPIRVIFDEGYDDAHYGFLNIVAIGLMFIIPKYPGLFTGKISQICSEFALRTLYDSTDKEHDLQAEFGKAFDHISPHEMLMSKQFIEVE